MGEGDFRFIHVSWSSSVLELGLLRSGLGTTDLLAHAGCIGLSLHSKKSYTNQPSRSSNNPIQPVEPLNLYCGGQT